MELRLFTLLLFVVSLSGCLEDEPTTVSSNAKLRDQLYLSQFYEGEQVAIEFKYNGENQVTQQIVSSPDGNFVGTMEYNGFDKISSMKGVQNGTRSTADFYYVNYGDEMKIDSVVTRVDGSLWSISKFIYYENGFLQRMMQYTAGSPLIHNDYFWQDGNVIRMERYFPRINPENTVKWITDFEYDTLKNPYAEVYKDIGYHIINNEPLTKNNWTSLSVGRTDVSRVITRVNKTHQYIAPGYPTRTRTKVFDSNNQLFEETVSDYFY